MDHQTLLKCLQSEDVIDKLAGWQLILFEFNLNIYHVSDRELIIADDLFRLTEYFSLNTSLSEIFMISFMTEFCMTDEQSNSTGFEESEDEFRT